jgi:hypothetical protein
MRDTDAGRNFEGSKVIKESAASIFRICSAARTQKPNENGWRLPGFPMITDYVLWISNGKRRRSDDLVRA